MGFNCATYPFGRMFVLIPNKEEWIQVSSAQQFINLIEHEGMGFGLDKAMPKKWRGELTASNDRS
jgi:hypothetical protein